MKQGSAAAARGCTILPGVCRLRDLPLLPSTGHFQGADGRGIFANAFVSFNLFSR